MTGSNPLKKHAQDWPGSPALWTFLCSLLQNANFLKCPLEQAHVDGSSLILLATGEESKQQEHAACCAGLTPQASVHAHSRGGEGGGTNQLGVQSATTLFCEEM